MTPFVTWDAIAAPYLAANVDTDKIIPARFLKTISKTGLGEALFHDLRRDEKGRLRLDFLLNSPPWNSAGILVTGANFGCGSSREHAPWALADFGIRCIIAPSFADIFYNNCFKNGLLPIALPTAAYMTVAGQVSGPIAQSLRIDLPERSITLSDDTRVPFTIDPERAQALIIGQDDIDITLRHVNAIDLFEANSDEVRPWLAHASLNSETWTLSL